MTKFSLHFYKVTDTDNNTWELCVNDLTMTVDSGNYLNKVFEGTPNFISEWAIHNKFSCETSRLNVDVDLKPVAVKYLVNFYKIEDDEGNVWTASLNDDFYQPLFLDYLSQPFHGCQDELKGWCERVGFTFSCIQKEIIV